MSIFLAKFRSLKNDEVNQQLEKVYGAIRESSADKQKEIEKYRKIYRAGGSQPGESGTPRFAAELPAETNKLSTWPW